MKSSKEIEKNTNFEMMQASYDNLGNKKKENPFKSDIRF